jgi:hypothetical protein
MRVVFATKQVAGGKAKLGQARAIGAATQILRRAASVSVGIADRRRGVFQSKTKATHRRDAAQRRGCLSSRAPTKHADQSAVTPAANQGCAGFWIKNLICSTSCSLGCERQLVIKLPKSGAARDTTALSRSRSRPPSGMSQALR